MVGLNIGCGGIGTGFSLGGGGLTLSRQTSGEPQLTPEVEEYFTFDDSGGFTHDDSGGFTHEDL